MKRAVWPLTAVALLLSAACARERPDALEKRLRATADPAAWEALASMFRAYGGYDAWSRLKTAECTYRLDLYGGGKTPRATTRQIHRFGLGPTVQTYVEDLDIVPPQIVRLDGARLEVTRGGQPVPEPELLDFPRAYSGLVRWSFRSPWSLLDDGSRLQVRGVRTPQTSGAVPAGPCDVVRLRFDAPSPAGSTDDWYDFYISRRSHLVEQVHSYRAVDHAYRVSIWSDHRSFDGVRLAARRETHASDESGAIGPLEAVVEYRDVRFDAEFGEEMFRGSAPKADTTAVGAAAGPG